MNDEKNTYTESLHDNYRKCLQEQELAMGEQDKLLKKREEENEKLILEAKDLKVNSTIR
jgi:hypothetical protein